MEGIEVARLTKSYGRLKALDDVSLWIRPGELTAVLGPSGSGKSTLGEVLAGTLRPDRGLVRVDGADVTLWPAHRRGIPLAPQEWDLFPHLTAAENIAFSLRARGVAWAEQREISAAMLARVGLAGRGHALPHQLSGGQQQRVAVARTLAMRSRYAVLDEPFANVDKDTRALLGGLLREEVQVGKGIVFVTHDQSDGLSLADRVIGLVDGVVVANGTPADVYAAPASLAAARLTGDAFLVPLSVFSSRWQEELFARAGTVVPPQDAISRLAVIGRPTWFRVVREPSARAFEATLRRTWYHGESYTLDAVCQGTALRLQSPAPLTTSTVSVGLRDGITFPIVPVIGDRT